MEQFTLQPKHVPTDDTDKKASRNTRMTQKSHWQGFAQQELTNIPSNNRAYKTRK